MANVVVVDLSMVLRCQRRRKPKHLASNQQYCYCAAPPVPHVLVWYIDIGYPLSVLAFFVFHGINKHPRVVSATIDLPSLTFIITVKSYNEGIVKLCQDNASIMSTLRGPGLPPRPRGFGFPNSV